jgi:hypothetical protein
MDFDDLGTMLVHDITPEYVREVRAMGQAIWTRTTSRP